MRGSLGRDPEPRRVPSGPPRALEVLAGWILPRAQSEFVLGDLAEQYRVRATRAGRRRATVWYLGAAARSAWEARRRRARPARSWRPFQDVRTDVRIALRTLRRRPGFALLAIWTLALGVGATTAVFGVVNQFMLRPLPGVRDGAGAAYVEFHDASGSGRNSAISVPVLDHLRADSRMADGVAGFALTNLLAAGPQGEAAALTGQVVAGDYFAILGVRPATGRLFGADEADDVVVLSERARSRLFGAAGAVGRTVRLNRRPVTVVGVVDAFAGVQPWITVDAWVPVPAFARLTGREDPRADVSRAMFSQLVSRPRAGASFDALEADLDGHLAAVARLYPAAALSGVRARVFPRLGVEPMWRADTAGALRVLAGVVMLVLLVACANVANLLLFRALRRRGDTAVRRALGASGGRVARQQLAESLAIACAGVLCGSVVAFFMTELLEGMRLATTGQIQAFRIDVRVLVFLSGLVVLTALLAGAAPAFLARAVDLRHALGDAGRHTRRGARLRAATTVVQLSVSLCLLVGSLLLVRTVRQLYAIDPGFEVEGLHLITTFAQHVAPGDADAYSQRLLLSLRSVPGVEDAALDSFGPFGPSFGGRVLKTDGDALQVRAPHVSDGWFRTMGIRIVAGRAFGADADPAGGVVISSALATRLFGTESAVGRTIRLQATGADESTVVLGVAADARIGSLSRAADLVVYRPWRAGSALTALVRTPVSPAMTGALQAAARAAGPDLPPPEISLAARRLDGQLGEQRFFARLLPILSLLAAGLAAVGLYGVIATGVAERTREFGIRRALGARDGRIVRQVLEHALVLVAAGFALGLPAAFLFARVLQNRLYGIGPLDPLSWVGAIVLFIVVALVACLAPVRAAVRVDPVGALRQG